MPIPSAKLRVGEFPKKLTLTPESKALLERGAAGQGYVYFIEMKNGNIHCLPAVNVEKNEIKKTNQT
ncbi:MAG TPA: hypothetical protein VHM20_06215, partial [Gammaproteobacteria bacterium]|nr:hypothetical protein [Gammaproteobacteria bacterium]